ncbi:MAG: hypothetical protein PSW75_03660, partial [bacterium]|nr:hypothetical protein [bacterium]
MSKSCHSERSDPWRARVSAGRGTRGRGPSNQAAWILRFAQHDSRQSRGCGFQLQLFTGWKPAALLCTIAAAFLLLSPAAAQQAAFRVPPRLGYVYPAGAQQGTTVTISLGGQNLADASAIRLTGPGLSSKITGYHRPLNQKEVNELRDQLEQLQKKREAAQADPKAPALTPENIKFATEARAKLANRQQRQANPALSENVTIELTVAADAPPGARELRLRTPNGFSNPIVFQVGTLPEFVSPIVTAENPAAEGAARRTDPRVPLRQPPTAITLPVLVNGQILPGEVDRYQFSARAGQRLTLVTSARALLPYLADAVPGWFQATLALYDAKGREVAYDDDFRFSPDPVLAYVIPADGDYTVEIKDSIYRGREDFIYRLALGELPFITSIYPLGCAPSPKSIFKLTGWNLPAEQLDMDTTSRPPGWFDLFVRNRAHVSNTVLFVVDPQADTAELEPNDTPAHAQPLTLPADGDYFIHVTDAQHQGSPAHDYSLRDGPPRPDYEMRDAPSAVN